MTVVLWAAFALLIGLVPCLWVMVRGGVGDALVALELASSLITVTLMLFALGYGRASYWTLPIALAVLSVVGNLILVRLFPSKWL